MKLMIANYASYNFLIAFERTVNKKPGHQSSFWIYIREAAVKFPWHGKG